MKFHAIRAYAILTILILLILTPIAVGAKSPTTIKQQMDILHNRRKVNFVYDANDQRGAKIQWALHRKDVTTKGAEDTVRRHWHHFRTKRELYHTEETSLNTR